MTCLSTGIVPLLASRGVPSVYTLHDYWLLCHRGQLLDVHDRLCAGPEPGGCSACVNGPTADVVPLGAAPLVRAIERRLPGALRKGVHHATAHVASRRAVRRRGQDAASRRLEHMRAVCSGITRFLAPSRSIRQRFIAFGIDEARVALSQYGFDRGSFGAGHSSRAGPLRLGFVGTLMLSKAPHLLLEAHRDLPAGAATAHLAGGSTVGASGDLERVSALARLLSELLTEQSDREAMTAFAEALAVWHDVELRGYVEAAGDDYRLDVAPPGAAESTAPLRLSLDGLLEDRGVAVLSGADAHRLGFEALGDTVTARVGVGRGSWLLFLSGQIDPLTVARLDVYVRMLAQWMVAKLADGRARLTTAMASAFLSSTATLDRVARQALELLEREVGSGALVSVTTATGAPLVRAGGAGSSLDRSAGEPLVLIRRSADAPVVTLAVTEPDGRPLTAVQCAAAQSAAELFETWSRAVESRAGVGERRASSRPPDEVFERMAAQAAERGVGVSALVLSSPLLVFRPEHAQVWLARARALMRTSDVIGMLGESEVGVLLHDATGEQAGIVARRLTRAVEKDEPSLGGSLRIGMATRLAGAAAVPGLVQEARRGMGGHGHQWPQREGGTRQ